MDKSTIKYTPEGDSDPCKKSVEFKVIGCSSRQDTLEVYATVEEGLFLKCEERSAQQSKFKLFVQDVVPPEIEVKQTCLVMAHDELANYNVNTGVKVSDNLDSKE